METFDAIVVGGGPAGSTCARQLVRGGLRVAVLDAARFPRVKLCAGWISRPTWEILELAPSEYPLGLWEWNHAHVHFAGKTHRVRSRGHFIRRYEFDEFLLRRSGATSIEGHRVRDVRRDDQGQWIVDGAYQAAVLVGAGGTQCPVARLLFPKRPEDPVTTQEHEFETDSAKLAQCRPGRDGEPELLLLPKSKGFLDSLMEGRFDSESRLPAELRLWRGLPELARPLGARACLLIALSAQEREALFIHRCVGRVR